MTRKMKDSGVEWIGKIPEDWKLRKIKYILSERKEKNNPVVTENILSLSIERGVFPYSEKTGGGNKAKDDLTAYKVARPNDIVINSMNILAGAVGISKYTGAVSPVYYTLYSSSDFVNVKYYYYLFMTETFQKSLLGLGNGIMMKESANGKLNTIRMRISMDKLSSLYLPFPSKDTQNRIVKKIEGFIELIDSIISETQQSIDELKKYKQALITETVTKGLDKNAEMKDSGIEWIGKIPKTWDVKKVGNFYSQVKNKNLKLQESNLLSLSYGNIIRRNINATDGLLPDNFAGYNIVKPQDIVLRMTDLQNDQVSLRTGIVKETGIITSAYITIRKSESPSVDSRYIQLLLHSFDINKGFYGMGSGVRQGVTFNDIKKIPIVVPCYGEQQDIVTFLERKVSSIDEIIIEKQDLIAQLIAYKQSLIYEYVTGKIEA